MDLTEATSIFETLKTSTHKQEFEDLLSCAIIYSRIRVDWYINIEHGLEVDESHRTHAHNDFISACAALSEKMKESGEDIAWRFRIGKDRKSIGDFACMLHAVIGIKAR
jgi:hypothetical protein